MNNNYNTYPISGKTYPLKRYADVHDTIFAIKRIIVQQYTVVSDLAKNLQGNNEQETFKNIWNFVRNNILYQNDEKGKEQLRRPQRTLHDKTGDCDDFSILISSILMNLGIKHELLVTAYKKESQWQHIYPVAYDTQGNRFVIDCVPEIPYFNYEAKPIINKIIINMKLEELGELGESIAISELTEPFNLDESSGSDTEDEELIQIQGLLGNVAIVDEDEEYDTVLSGSELYRNLIVRQLIEAKNTLTKELSKPTELSQLSDPKEDLEHVNNIIDSIDDDEDLEEAVQLAIESKSLYSNFYKTIQYAVNNAMNGLAGNDDDAFYLKIMEEEGMLDQLIVDDDLEGLGKFKMFNKLKNKIKKGVTKLKNSAPKLPKIGRGLVKYSPQGFAVRRSIEIFFRANALKMASKIALGYATEKQAKRLGYSKSEWSKFVTVKNKTESKWYSLGGKKAYFKKMIMGGRGAKVIGLQGIEGLEGFLMGQISGDNAFGELGVAPAVLMAVTKAFGTIMELFKALDLKKKQDAVVVNYKPDSNAMAYNKTGTMKTYNTTTQSFEKMPMPNTDEKSGVSEEVITDENGKETKVYKDKDGNDIGKIKAFFLKNKMAIMIVSIVLVVGIIGIIIYKIRQRSINGLGSTGLSQKQQNFIRKQGLDNKAIAALIREEMAKDGKKDNTKNRKFYYQKVFKEAYAKPISEKQVSATLNHNAQLKKVRTLAKQYGGGSEGWRKAWAEVKKK